MKTHAWLALAAVAFLAVALVYGLAPVKSGSYDCGSAFHANGDLAAQEFSGSPSNCDEARNGRLPVAIAALVLAAVAAGAAYLVRPVEPQA